jgi:hypothetical protein
MELPIELRDNLARARRAFDNAATSSSPNTNELANEYLALLDQCLNLLAKKHLGLQSNIQPGPSSSWEAIDDLRKDAEVKITEIRSEQARVNETLKRIPNEA